MQRLLKEKIETQACLGGASSFVSVFDLILAQKKQQQQQQKQNRRLHITKKLLYT